MAAEITSFDIDLSFAPVLDLHWAHSQVIGTRSFGAKHSQVTALTKSFVQGMMQAVPLSGRKHHQVFLLLRASDVTRRLYPKDLWPQGQSVHRFPLRTQYSRTQAGKGWFCRSRSWTVPLLQTGPEA